MESKKSIKNYGCEEENVAYRQVLQAVMPVGSSGEEESPKITLLYLVKAGTHEVSVVIDPDNMIVESNEDNNIMKVDEMGSNNGILDVGVEVVATYSVPAIILGATIALMWVAGVVMYGRRMDALDRFAEKSSLLANLSDDDQLF